MDDKTITTGILMDEGTKISFIEICQKCNISEQMLLEMIEHGLLHHEVHYSNKIHVDSKTFLRIQSASRLHQDLGINIPGVVLALELLDELEKITSEFDILHHHVHRG